MHVVDAKTADRRIRSLLVEVGRGDLRYLAPGGESFRSNIRPILASVVSDPDQTVIRTRPKRIDSLERWSEGVMTPRCFSTALL